MRGIPSAPDRLKADVEGDIDAVEGVLRITKIRVNYHLVYTQEQQEKVDRAFQNHPVKCPAYMSLKDAIDFDLDLTQTK